MAGVGQRLEMRQGQSLVMTPQLQQAIKLLQLSNVELAEYCESELEKNPLLERDDAAAAISGEGEAAQADTIGERADEALSRDVLKDHRRTRRRTTCMTATIKWPKAQSAP